MPAASGPCGWTPPADRSIKRAPPVRILIVEDEAAIREGLREQFTQAGFAVDVAANGQDGLHAGLEQPIDLAIIDLGLPLISGLDLIRKLRQKGKSFPS